MKLVRARVTKFRSIDDSTPVDIGDVTCLVGKNESGKTSFLRALYLLDPVQSEVGFDMNVEYPRKDWADYKQRHATDPDTVVHATFELEQADIEAAEAAFGKGVLVEPHFTLKKNYANKTIYSLKVNEAVVLRHFVQTKVEQQTVRDEILKHVTNYEGLLAALEAHADASVKQFGVTLKAEYPQGVTDKVFAWVDERAPRFVYFSDYEFMPGSASIPQLIQRRNQKNLAAGELTLVRLVKRAGLTLEELQTESNFERHTADLEAAAIAITREVFRYWTQNKNLKVQFRTSAADAHNPKLTPGPLLRVRILNTKHDVTVPFDERSRGFVWFFSFLAYFHEIEKDAKTPLILLLDEPGLSLHATAQRDLLRFIEERLAPKHQVLYTTHSPFMVDAMRMDRVRTVQDLDEEGTVVSKDVIRNDRDTLFPLQAALGYEITQSLFVGPNSLLVEGPSEVLYLPTASEQLAIKKRTVLDPRWTLTPVGGVDKVPSFVSLFGAQKLRIAVLMDFAAKQAKFVDTLRANPHLGKDKVLPLNEMRGGKDTDIEDLFEPDEFLAIVNQVYRRELPSAITQGDLSHKSDRIVEKLAHYFEAQNVNKGKFEHGRVADHYARHQKDFPPLSDATLARFEEVFKRVNKLLT